MRIQLIQQKVPIGSQVTFTLKTGEKISGSLAELGKDYITLDVANRQKTILVDAILMFDIQGQDNEVEASNPTDANTESSDSDTEQVDVPESTDINTESPDNEVEAYNSTDANTESSDSDTEQVDVPESTDINTESPDNEVEAYNSTDANTESSDSDTEQVDVPESTDINTESSDSDTEQVDVSESTDVNTESSDSDTEQVDVSESTDINTEQISTSESADANTESTDTANFEEQASEKLTEIVTQFNIEIEATSIELEPPNFTFPAKELTSWQNTDVAGKWLQIKNKYENAQRINELSTKFGRIQPLLMEVKSLVRRFPNSPSLKRVTAYFYAVSDDWQEAIQIHKEVAITSDNPNDWFNVAVSALNLNKKELACYSLEKFFYNGSVIDAPNAWNIYVSLVEKFNNLSAFRELCKKDENDVVENEIEVLLDAAIYLLKKKVATELAIEVVEKRIKGEPAEFLLKEICQKLGGQSAESYRQFLSEFMNEMIALEKKTYPITSETSEQIGTVKKPVHLVTRHKPNLQRAKRTGEFIRDDNSIIDLGFLNFSGELSEFARFFLERCKFEGIEAVRVNEGKYVGSDEDVQRDTKALEDFAKQLGTKRPHDRSNYYLSAARIYIDVGDDRDLFYRYLCRSFASRGDAAVTENRSLDIVREWYCEALTVYDGDRGRRKGEEQDAVNSLVRYLYSTLGHAHIDLTPKIPSIDKALRDVIDDHQDKEIVFETIAYLVLHSKYAAEKVLNRLYHNKTLRTITLNYLEGMKITIPDTVDRFNIFTQLWNELRHVKFNDARTLSNELQLLENFDFTTAWLEDSIQHVEDIRSRLFFELDQQRVGELQEILKTALELCKQVTFEERERLCIQLRNHCQDRLREIEESPTKLSVEDVYPIIEVIQEKVKTYLEELHETSKPQLTLRLPVESYVPDTDRQIEVQIVLENERGRSPAESLELIVQEDVAFFRVTEPNIKQNESLRGSEQSILTIRLRVTLDALQTQTFSLSLCAQYRTRTEEQVQTPVQDLSIRLYSEDEFEKIENPYAAYAEGGIVGDTNMFFGREELIRNIAQAIQESQLQSKCVLVFGQKRSGKSSVLYHLKELLQEDRELLILDLGNMSTLLDQHAQTSLLHQFLNGILRAFERAIQRKQHEGLSPLELAIPGKEFYDHPAPLQLFEDTFVKLKDLTNEQAGQEDWRGTRVVLLIDEFQYIYDPIIEGKIPDSFMKNWKALLQANYFSAVLVGQDVMKKFKLRFPNEFGTAQDERVTYLKEEDAQKLIEEPIRIGGTQGESRYREQAIERILELTAGSPFYIQIICNRLVDYMNVKHAGLVTEADVEQVKNELIHDVNALGLDKFDNLINSGDTSPDAISDEDALKVLKVIADNSYRTDPCHRDRIVCQTNSPIDTILDDLVNRDVVKRRDQSYQIQVGLFKEWLTVNG